MEFVMKTKTSALIAALILTAIVLSAVVLTTSSRPAEAAMLNAQADFSLLTVGLPGGNESLVIIDKNQGKMLVYELNGNQFKVTGAFHFGK
jgi:hypothetical protein